MGGVGSRNDTPSRLRDVGMYGGDNDAVVDDDDEGLHDDDDDDEGGDGCGRFEE